MPKPQQNEIEQIKKEIDILQVRISFKMGNTSKKRTKDGSFSNQKNTKYSEENISK